MIRGLHFIDANFNNGIIAANWYRGVQLINEIRFDYCLINVIEKDAFNASAFQTTRLLRISNNIGLLTFQPGCFNGLGRLEKFLLNNSTIMHIDAKTGLLSESCKSLNEVQLTAVNASVDFKYFFKNNRYTNFETMIVDHSTSHKFHTLAPANFSNTLIIKAFQITGGELKVILAGTFDTIAKSLQRLILWDTKLMVFKATLFQAYFEYSYMVPGVSTMIAGDQYECNCDYYLLRNLTTMTIRMSSVNGYVFCHNKRGPIGRCHDFQRLQSKHLCWSHYFSHSYAYTRFDVRLDNGRDAIVVRTNASGRFKVIFQMNELLRKEFCPNQNWLRDNIKCFVLKRKRPEISKSFFNRSQVLRISIFYFIHGWPLSLTVMRMPDDDGSRTVIIVVICALICFVFVFVGCLIAIWKYARCDDGDTERYYENP